MVQKFIQGSSTWELLDCNLHPIYWVNHRLEGLVQMFMLCLDSVEQKLISVDTFFTMHS